MQGAVHHLELHAAALTDAHVADVVRQLQHVNLGLPPIPACVDCSAGMQDSDVNPATPCEPCGVATVSSQTGTTECTGTCPVGATILFSGATSSSACSQCTVGRYGSIEDGVATCQQCEAGRASTQLGATSVSSCASCTPGRFSAPGSTDCDPGGCMDEWADNYSPSAIVDDGACDYTCSQVRELAGFGASDPGGCFFSSELGWQRYAHNGTALVGGYLDMHPEESWVVQGRPLPGSTSTSPMFVPYPTSLRMTSAAVAVRCAVHSMGEWIVDRQHSNPFMVEYCNFQLEHATVADNFVTTGDVVHFVGGISHMSDALVLHNGAGEAGAFVSSSLP
jgi:hypothetical protein